MSSWRAMWLHIWLISMKVLAGIFKIFPKNGWNCHEHFCRLLYIDYISTHRVYISKMSPLGSNDDRHVHYFTTTEKSIRHRTFFKAYRVQDKLGATFEGLVVHRLVEYWSLKATFCSSGTQYCYLRLLYLSSHIACPHLATVKFDSFSCSRQYLKRRQRSKTFVISKWVLCYRLDGFLTSKWCCQFTFEGQAKHVPIVGQQ